MVQYLVNLFYSILKINVEHNLAYEQILYIFQTYLTLFLHYENDQA